MGLTLMSWFIVPSTFSVIPRCTAFSTHSISLPATTTFLTMSKVDALGLGGAEADLVLIHVLLTLIDHTLEDISPRSQQQDVINNPKVHLTNIAAHSRSSQALNEIIHIERE